MKRKVFALSAILLVVLTFPVLAQDEDLTILDDWLEYANANESLYRDLSRQAGEYLKRRRQEVASIETLEGWKRRQEFVRSALMQVVGPFPEPTPLNAQITGRLDRPLFTVEKLVFESQPGFYVTAALFLPKRRSGRAPAIVYCSGHTDNGFRSETYQTAILNLARKGFIVLAFDPFGQGERQAYLDEQGVSRVGGATRQHSYPGAQLFLLGQSLAKYAIWDGIRAIDYLISRPEVDPDRIGITGRSGGGTQAAYIAAFDERVVAAAPEAYITRFERLLDSIGPQDAEQNFFGGIQAGLDHADLLAVRAPKPALMITTTRDFFSIQGARETYAEVKRIYDAYGAGDAFEMVEDDAPHASTKKNREAMYRFFLDRFSIEGSHEEEEVEVFEAEALQVTPTGQVVTSYDAETVYSLMQEEIRRTEPAFDRGLLPAAIANIAGYRPVGDPVNAVFAGRYQRTGYAVERYILSGDGGYPIPLLAFVPSSPGPHPVLLYLDPRGKDAAASIGGDLEGIAQAGYLVVAPDLPGTGELSDDEFRGDAYLEGVSLNIWFAGVLIGRSISGIQATDISRVTSFAESLSGANPSVMAGVARGTLGDPLLHAAAMDPRLGAVAVVESLLSYKHLATREYYSPALMVSAVPGALAHYDLFHVAASLAPRPLALIRPVDHQAEPATAAFVGVELSVVEAEFDRVGAAGRLEVVLNENSASWTILSWMDRVVKELERER